MSKPIDWSQLWYPGPTRQFTDAELRQAGHDRPDRTLVTMVLLNFLFLGFVLMQVAPQAVTAPLTAAIAVSGVLGSRGAMALWRRPSRRRLTLWSFLGTMALGVFGGVLVEWQDLARGSAERVWMLTTVFGLAALLSLGWWFLAVWRAHQIEARLREQAEQARALAMAGQLAAAQIQPHFLYNALAALQHWVQVKDDRAAPLLDALTGFLRATLPLFNRSRLALGDEAAAAREYLEVMRLRLGERLRYGIDIEPAAATAAVPPGLLLTLVENAVEHGEVPSLHGAEVQVSARAEAGHVVLEVADTGPGLAPGATDGIGLGNTRTRLQQSFDGRARLSLAGAPEGGCIARIEFPLELP
jgi:signal transduction histidine kinase